MSIMIMGFVALAFIGVNENENKIYTNNSYEHKCEAIGELRRIISFAPENELNKKTEKSKNRKSKKKIDSVRLQSSIAEATAIKSSKIIKKPEVKERIENDALTEMFSEYGIQGGFVALILIFVGLRYTIKS